MQSPADLRAAKRLALWFLAGAASLFIISLFLPPRWWSALLRAFSEAAMIGALADWFAVVALFKRVPIPFVSRHTAIIPKNKDKIADNLALFVREKFLDTESLVGLIRGHDPARAVSDWLIAPGNAEQFGAALIKLAAGILDFIDDAPVQQFIRKAVHTLIRSVDLSASSAAILDSMTRNGRHQQLLNAAISQVNTLLQDDTTQAILAGAIVDWMKQEYTLFEKILPTEAIGRKGADIVVRMTAALLARVDEDAEHPIRQQFDSYTRNFIARLKDDPEMLVKAEEIKEYLLGDATFNAYLKSLWDDLKQWLKDDLASPQSVLHQRVVATGHWVGRTLADDPALCASLNAHLEDTVRAVAPEFAHFLTTHIANTVKQWDSRAMSEQIEFNIGKDLQFIRINGTVVGGLIGVLLYLLAQLPALLGMARLE